MYQIMVILIMSSINEVIDQAQLLYPLNYQSSAQVLPQLTQKRCDWMF